MPKFFQHNKDKEPSFFENNSKAILLLVTTFATAALLKQQGFSWALRFYPGGGAGLNVYKYCQDQSKPLRRYALDYHPIWDKALNKNINRLHYHRGVSYNQVKKHRPYEGGW